jgi:hypothetical protein
VNEGERTAALLGGLLSRMWLPKAVCGGRLLFEAGVLPSGKSEGIEYPASWFLDGRWRCPTYVERGLRVLSSDDPEGPFPFREETVLEMVLALTVAAEEAVFGSTSSSIVAGRIRDGVKEAGVG